MHAVILRSGRSSFAVTVSISASSAARRPPGEAGARAVERGIEVVRARARRAGRRGRRRRPARTPRRGRPRSRRAGRRGPRPRARRPLPAPRPPASAAEGSAAPACGPPLRTTTNAAGGLEVGAQHVARRRELAGGHVRAGRGEERDGRARGGARGEAAGARRRPRGRRDESGDGAGGSGISGGGRGLGRGPSTPRRRGGGAALGRRGFLRRDEDGVASAGAARRSAPAARSLPAARASSFSTTSSSQLSRGGAGAKRDVNLGRVRPAEDEACTERVEAALDRRAAEMRRPTWRATRRRRPRDDEDLRRVRGSDRADPAACAAAGGRRARWSRPARGRDPARKFACAQPDRDERGEHGRERAARRPRSVAEPDGEDGAVRDAAVVPGSSAGRGRRVARLEPDLDRREPPERARRPRPGARAPARRRRRCSTQGTRRRRPVRREVGLRERRVEPEPSATSRSSSPPLHVERDVGEERARVVEPEDAAAGGAARRPGGVRRGSGGTRSRAGRRRPSSRRASGTGPTRARSRSRSPRGGAPAAPPRARARAAAGPGSRSFGPARRQLVEVRGGAVRTDTPRAGRSRVAPRRETRSVTAERRRLRRARRRPPAPRRLGARGRHGRRDAHHREPAGRSRCERSMSVAAERCPSCTFAPSRGGGRRCPRREARRARRAGRGPRGGGAFA